MRSTSWVAVVLIAVLLAGCGGGVEVVRPQYDVARLNEIMLQARQRPYEPSRRTVLIPAGTIFPVRLLDTLSTRKNRLGDTFYFEVTEDVRVGGLVAIPMGARGQGRVTHVQRAGGGGRSGEIEFVLDYVHSAHGDRIGVRTSERTVAQDRQAWGAGTVIGTLFFGPIYLLQPALTKGYELEIRQYVQFYVETSADAEVRGYRYY